MGGAGSPAESLADPVLAGALLIASLGLASAAAGCSYPSSEQAFPGTCEPLAVISSLPADGAGDLPTDAPISLTFSDFPDPDSVRLDTVLLSSGLYTRLGGFSVDLITRSVRFDARNPLQADLTYRVTVTSAVRSLTGCAATGDQREFATGDGLANPPISPPIVPAFSAILPIFAAHCAGAGCHRPAPDDGTCLDAPAQGLSLCDRDAWAALVGADATELTGIERVLPGDAARSYLMRKLVTGPNGGPVPTTPGQREPPGAPLADDELRAISDWIDGGAPR